MNWLIFLIGLGFGFFLCLFIISLIEFCRYECTFLLFKNRLPNLRLPKWGKKIFGLIKGKYLLSYAPFAWSISQEMQWKLYLKLETPR